MGEQNQGKEEILCPGGVRRHQIPNARGVLYAEKAIVTSVETMTDQHWEQQ